MLYEISIHAPREGSDVLDMSQLMADTIFQSTLPVRGATRVAVRVMREYLEFQSTLPVRGATSDICSSVPAPSISIHAPREGSDGSEISS